MNVSEEHKAAVFRSDAIREVGNAAKLDKVASAIWPEIGTDYTWVEALGRASGKITDDEHSQIHHRQSIGYARDLARAAIKSGASSWPDFSAPPMYDDPHPDWEDTELPDFRKIWAVAHSVGYAIGLHGSMKRDCDLIAVPWVEGAECADRLADDLCRALNAKRVGDWEQKPLGRLAISIQIDGYFKNIDLSVMGPLYKSGYVDPAVNTNEPRP